MKKNYIKLAIISSLALALFIPVIIFFSRAPVLIVAEQSLLTLYGQARLNRDVNKRSLALFRQVKIVQVVNDAGDDIVQYAVSDISAKPFCVIFSRRFAGSARIYSEQNPGIKIILLEGRYPENANPAGITGFHVYYTDIESDFFRAGYAAAAFVMGNSPETGNIAVFIEPEQYSNYGSQARNAFLRGVEEAGSGASPYFYTSFQDFPQTLDISCVVLAGAGWTYMDEKTGVPVILFSWLDPLMAPLDVVLIVDDSPFSQFLNAVSMLASGQEKGSIKSNFLVLTKDKKNSKVLRNINNM